ncbi:MAG: HD domain-containing protein [Magnetococcales bacterium]|nr:HD domain-containing protein [Magnetococcales bacterium]
MEEQLRTAIQIVSTTPWVGLTGRGALFMTEQNTGQMHLVAQSDLSAEELRQVRKVPLSRCLCQKEENWRNVLQFPQDDPGHVVCLQNPHGHGNYCFPIPGAHGPVGVMHMQLKTEQISRDEEAFFSTIAGTMAGIIERRRMELALQEKHDELRRTRLDVIHRLGMAAEYRDQDTGQHVVRMSKYAAILARGAGLPEETCDILIHAAPMHDVGKIGIPDHILLKPERLDDHEWEIMKKHPLIGSMMLHGYDAEPMNTAHIIALTHHERWDGKGYPIGVPGEEIPIEGRICAIADVFDALTSDRPYKKAWSVAESAEEIRKGAGTAFDPHLVKVFFEVLPEIVAIKDAHEDS